MINVRWRLVLASSVVVLFVGIGYAWTLLPSLGAGGLLHPVRRQVISTPPPSCVEQTFAGVGINLEGWICSAPTARRGTVVYLHGIGDNRSSGIGVIGRFVKRGFDVVAYDSRAHGASEGTACTYGFFEKQDLQKVLDGVGAGPIVLLGTSLGAAVALQEAAGDPRITAIVAAETFSDLRTVAAERAPFFFTTGTIGRAFRVAEKEALFEADAVSPVDAARTIGVPVLLIHGEADVETPPDHSRRVFAALPGQKRLLLVPGAAHNSSLQGDVWRDVEQWIDEVLGTHPGSI